MTPPGGRDADLAHELRQRALFDIEDPSSDSGERWILAMPGGAVSKVDVTEYDDGVGLPESH
ncbi:hypothetical protein [Mycobacteroides franklinii]|uniref:Uncharacterized protein n=1 Tax=Mycobacteroides franklinii TaxID=948102 RepID=A0A4R5PGF7_9MYCO|nr:hypothetical protein [Mycobacteroides franklinii]TDH25764.1 hypothetical protein EJ571_00160 [Mycobacteroides franklinii]